MSGVHDRPQICWITRLVFRKGGKSGMKRAVKACVKLGDSRGLACSHNSVLVQLITIASSDQ